MEKITDIKAKLSKRSELINSEIDSYNKKFEETGAERYKNARNNCIARLEELELILTHFIK